MKMYKEELSKKDSLTMDEMKELFTANRPGFIPTPNAVGRFAKKVGFVRVTQMRDGKQTSFYIKKEFSEYGAL